MTPSQPNTSHTQLFSTVNSAAIYDEPLYSNTFNHLTATDACLGFSNTQIVHTPYHHQQIHRYKKPNVTTTSCQRSSTLRALIGQIENDSVVGQNENSNE
ncbi:unnamed protein product [Rotaria socialis]|nr:unnamed protein product [Rotaria socialis]